MKIEKFEIDNWGTVKVTSEYHNGRTTSHEYSGVPKHIVVKLLSAKTAPDMADLEGWMRDHRAKQAKKYKDRTTVSCYDWWTDDD
jgi:hypothetical protein